jgi:hypothetical protein
MLLVSVVAGVSAVVIVSPLDGVHVFWAFLQLMVLQLLLASIQLLAFLLLVASLLLMASLRLRTCCHSCCY